MPSVARVALVLAALGALTLWRARARGRAAEAACPPEGTFVVVDGVRVHAVQRGAGPDLVLIHGASGNLRDFTLSLVPRLEGRYRVTAFDRPGHGYTGRLRRFGPFDPAAESPAEQAALLRAAAARLGVRRPIVLGFSYGASVALAWALDDPEGTAAVVDVSGVAMPWPGRLGWLYRLNGTRLGGALAPVLVAAFAPARVVARAVAGTFAPDPVPPGYAGRLGTGLTLRAAAQRANGRQVATLRPHVAAMSARYATLPMPVEIVHGDADPIVPIEVHSRPLAALVPGARLSELPGRGHMPHHAAPEAVVAAIDRAWARATGEAGLAAP